MPNRKIQISEKSKEMLDILTGELEVDRPTAINIALAKGIQLSDAVPKEQYSNEKKKWTIPDNIIKEKDFILFKHLIVNEVQDLLDNDQLHKYMRLYIEAGIQSMFKIHEEKTSMEDLRVSIL